MDGRINERLTCEVSGQVVLRHTAARFHLAQSLKAELAALHVLSQTDISLVDGLSLLASTNTHVLSVFSESWFCLFHAFTIVSPGRYRSF